MDGGKTQGTNPCSLIEQRTAGKQIVAQQTGVIGKTVRHRMKPQTGIGRAGIGGDFAEQAGAWGGAEEVGGNPLGAGWMDGIDRKRVEEPQAFGQTVREPPVPMD
jgi:hypothetical protein